MSYRAYSLRSRGGTWQPWAWIQSNQVHTLRKHVQGHDIAVSVWEFEKPDKEAQRTGDLYLDFDASPEDLEPARRDALRTLDWLREWYGLDPSSLQIVFSGRRGFLIIVPRESFLTQPLPAPEKVYKKFCEFVKLSNPTLDASMYCRNHIIRLTNTIHQDTGLYRIQLRPDELRSLSIEEIRALAARPRAVPGKKPEYSPKLETVFKKIADYKPSFVVERVPSPRRNGDGDLPILDLLRLVDVHRLRRVSGGFQGPHPVHGSETGMNFRIDPQKKVWFCYRHQSGGGAWELLAVLEGVLDCSDAGKGSLRGPKFKKVLEIAKNKYGVEA